MGIVLFVLQYRKTMCGALLIFKRQIIIMKEGYDSEQ